jgi:hypothetical protein
MTNFNPIMVQCQGIGTTEVILCYFDQKTGNFYFSDYYEWESFDNDLKEQNVIPTEDWITCLIRNYEGYVSIDNTDINKFSPEILDEVGKQVFPQIPNMNKFNSEVMGFTEKFKGGLIGDVFYPNNVC